MPTHARGLRFVIATTFRQQRCRYSSILNPRPNEATPKARGWKRTIRFLFTTGVVLTMADEFVYEPLQKRGVFDSIAQATFFRFIGPKTITSDVATKHHLTYQGLTKPKEIRLLILQPGEADEQVSCSLVNVVLSWRTRYEALSYTWGDPTVTQEINCNGHRKQVTANLQTALHHLRYEDRPRVLWVDALCINQEDMGERESQVQMMGSIYSGARQVLIWLGEETEEVKGAFQVMSKLKVAFVSLHRKRYIANRLPFLDSPLESLFPTPLLGADFEWDPIVKLLERPWFQRTWIIQEAILPCRATVICGRTEMPWYTFEKVLQGISIYNGSVASVTKSEGMKHTVRAIQVIMLARSEYHSRGLRRLQSRQETSKILDLLIDSRSFQCTDKRDRIYGFLGVAKDVDGDLVPNYRISVEEAFRRFVVWDIITNGNLRTLSCSSDQDVSPYKLPSWVPDFTNLDDTHSLMRYEKRVNFDASKGTQLEVAISKDGKVLLVTGQAVDEVCEVGSASKGQAHFTSIAAQRLKNGQLVMQTMKFREMSKEYQIWMRECMQLVKRIDSTGGALNREQAKSISSISPERFEEFWRTMTCNHDARALPAPNTHGRWIVHFLEVLDPYNQADGQRLLQLLPGAQSFEQSMVVWAKNRRFCVTKEGRMGWVPKDARQGDVVCVLYGGRVPYVLRRCEKGYKLVGECYLHGIMQGEAIVEGGTSRDFAIV